MKVVFLSNLWSVYVQILSSCLTDMVWMLFMSVCVCVCVCGLSASLENKLCVPEFDKNCGVGIFLDAVMVISLQLSQW